MPFIWDDIEWLLMGDQEPYDKNRFVVARKLSVKPNTGSDHTLPIEEFSADQIRGHIEKFGEIESIEVLPTKDPEAHVTFISDRSAYLMLLQYEYNKEIKHPFDVEPVDSWEQPKENANSPSDHDMEVDEQTPEMFILNEDCLLHLFKFLDLDSLVNMADVCKMFNRLLHQHCFPRIRKYEVNCEEDPTITLAKVRRSLLCIGQHLTDLSFEAMYGYIENKDELKKTCDLKDRLSSKCLRIIAQLVGQNIRRANFMFDFSKDNQVSMIAPILQRLESLEIMDYDGRTSKDIDFPALCPNLIDFKLYMNTPMVACCKPWPTLRSLSISNNQHLQAKTLTSIVEKNPQLKCLKFDKSHSNRALFLAITNHLISLKKLTIHNGAVDFDFNHLGNLPSLRVIILSLMGVGELESVIDHLTTFTNLRRIRLSCHNPKALGIDGYEQSLMNLAEKLPFLEDLTLWKIPLDEVTLINIVCYARRLSLLDLWDCKLDFSDELIAKLVDVLKSYRKESDGALRLILDKEELEKLDSTKNKEIERYLQLQ